METYFVENEAAMLAFGGKLAEYCRRGTVIFLRGDLGAGKTTLVRGLLKALGFSGIVKSPTYTLVESYRLNEFSLFHFDLYRLNHAQELLDIGWEDYFNPEAVCLIEWPEKASEILPKADVSCTIEIPKGGHGRRIVITL